MTHITITFDIDDPADKALLDKVNDLIQKGKVVKKRKRGKQEDMRRELVELRLFLKTYHETHIEPLSQREIHKKLGWEYSRTHRRMQKLFSGGGVTEYQRLCKHDPESLKRILS